MELDFELTHGFSRASFKKTQTRHKNNREDRPCDSLNKHRDGTAPRRFSAMKRPDADAMPSEARTDGLPISGGKDLPGFHQVLGYRQVSWTDDEAVIELDVQACHLNMAGVLHGGVLTSLLDVVLAEAGTYCPHPGRVRKAITLVLNTTFTGQCSGGVIRAIGKRRAGGTRIFNSSGEIRDQHDRLLAIGEATFRLRSGSEHPQGVPLTLLAEHNQKENSDV
jgi:uncharacterized protein (TIGR00369 family)